MDEQQQDVTEKHGFWTKERRSLSDVIFVVIAFLFVGIPLAILGPSILKNIWDAIADLF